MYLFEIYNTSLIKFKILFIIIIFFAFSLFLVNDKKLFFLLSKIINWLYQQPKESYIVLQFLPEMLIYRVEVDILIAFKTGIQELALINRNELSEWVFKGLYPKAYDLYLKSIELSNIEIEYVKRCQSYIDRLMTWVPVNYSDNQIHIDTNTFCFCEKFRSAEPLTR